MTGKELPGKFVCNLGVDGGDLKWEYGKMVTERARLLTGFVRDSQEGTTLKLAAKGKNYPLETGKTTETIVPGAYVLAAEDPKTLLHRPVRVIDVVPQGMPVEEKPKHKE